MSEKSVIIKIKFSIKSKNITLLCCHKRINFCNRAVFRNIKVIKTFKKLNRLIQGFAFKTKSESKFSSYRWSKTSGRTNMSFNNFFWSLVGHFFNVHPTFS